MGNTHTQEDVAFAQAADVLRERAPLIARCAESLSTADPQFDRAVDLVNQLASHIAEPGESSIASSLPSTSEQEDACTARCVRIVEAFCIETIRHTIPEPEGTAVVTRLRERARDIIPKPAVSPEDFQFYEQFMEQPADGVPTDIARSNAFVHHVMSGLEEIVYVHDMNGAMLFVNKRAMAVTGFDRDDYYAGLSIYDIVAPESLPIVEGRLQSPHHAPWSPATINLLNKKGKRVGIEFRTRPLIERGELTGVVGMGHELGTASSDPATRPLGFIMLDGSGVVIEVSNEIAHLMGGRSEIVGTEIKNRIADPAKAMQIAASLATDESVESRVGLATGNKILSCRILGTRHTDHENETVWFFTVMGARGNDSEAMADGRINMLESVLTVAKGVAHELNNPLTGIWGQAQRLMETATDEAQRKRIEQIVQEAGRCRRIMEGLLGFARAESHGFTRLNLIDVVSNVAQMMRYQIETEGIEMVFEKADEPVPIHGDIEAMRSVVRHIIHNAQLAAHETPDGSSKRVHVAVLRDGHDALIRVTDSGPGVPKELQQHLFTPFYTTRTIGEGIGMGLSLCYGIVSEHRGTIAIENASDHGAIFTVRIPIAED